MTTATVSAAPSSPRSSAASGRGQFRNGNQRESFGMAKVCLRLKSARWHAAVLLNAEDAKEEKDAEDRPGNHLCVQEDATSVHPPAAGGRHPVTAAACPGSNSPRSRWRPGE